jgi:hypothetical protein
MKDASKIIVGLPPQDAELSREYASMVGWQVAQKWIREYLEHQKPLGLEPQKPVITPDFPEFPAMGLEPDSPLWVTAEKTADVTFLKEFDLLNKPVKKSAR